MTSVSDIDMKVLKRIKWEPRRSDLSHNDLVAMAQLADRIQPGSSLSDLGRLEWQYLNNPAGKAIVWKAEDKGLVVGQVAFLPVKIWIDGRERSAACAANILTDVNYRNKGVFAILAQKAVLEMKDAGIDLLYGLPNPSAYPTWIKRAGFIHVGDISDYLKLINPEKIFSKKIGNPLLLGIISFIAKAVFFIRQPARLNGLVIKELSGFDDDFSDLWKRSCSGIKRSIVREKEHLNWRYVSCPVRNYKIFSAYLKDRLIAFVVLRTVDDTGIKTGWIVDMFFDQTKVGVKALKNLITHSERYFRESGVDMVRAAVSGCAGTRAALISSGFLRAPRFFKPWPIKVIMNILGPMELTKNVLSSFYLTLGDNDSP